jgi:hypothetical protein
MGSSAGEPGVRASGAEVDAPCFVVVPRAPGQIQHLHTGTGGDGDDIDAAMDELFGDITDEQPGRFDVALVVIGVGLIAWWAILGSTGPGLVFGGIAIVLGLALPSRNALRRANRRWTGVKDRRQLRRGHPLDVNDKDVADLVKAYERVVVLSDKANGLEPAEVLGPAHQAVVEVASLLGTRRPGPPAEIDYVRKRTRALRGVAASLRAASSARARARQREDLQDEQAREQWAASVAEAREQLEASTGLGALAELEALRGRIRVEAGDGRAG